MGGGGSWSGGSNQHLRMPWEVVPPRTRTQPRGDDVSGVAVDRGLLASEDAAMAARKCSKG